MKPTVAAVMAMDEIAIDWDRAILTKEKREVELNALGFMKVKAVKYCN